MATINKSLDLNFYLPVPTSLYDLPADFGLLGA